MRTAIISDLHLGVVSGADTARREDVRARLIEAIAPADRVVVLGDLLELRERPTPTIVEEARPVLEALGAATEGRQLVLVPGNHDHELVGPALEGARLDRGGHLSLEGTFDPRDGALSRRVAELMPATEVVLAYPGIRLRDDVYAIHGHYLDPHLTVPRVESVLASALGRVTGSLAGGRPREPQDYEAALTPIYALAYALAQTSTKPKVTRGSNTSRAIWRRANPDGPRSLARVAIGRVAIPGAVAALNLLGLGPFRTDISAVELRRAGLRAMADVVSALGIEADHVIFGHTHRAGPFEGEADEWRLPGGGRLSNTGSWLHEAVFVEDNKSGRHNPYWPGSITWLGDSGPPELTNPLDGVDL